MAFSCGFFNAFNGDRAYNAEQMSQIFDGMILDGVYATIGDKFLVKEDSSNDNSVLIGSGRGWFNHTWNFNDADLPLESPGSNLLLPRIDAVVLDINTNENVRNNSIIFVTGTAGETPEKPTLIKENGHYQYPIAYVSRKANVEKIEQADIENTVGTSECPLVTGILQVVSIDDLLSQWKASWENLMSEYENGLASWTEEQETEFLQWKEQMTTDFDNYYTEFKAQLESFEGAFKTDLQTWFDTIRDILDTDQAGHLQNEIDALTEKTFLRYYGLATETTVINGSSISTVNQDVTINTTIGDRLPSTEESVLYKTTILTSVIPKSGSFQYNKTTDILEESDGGTTINTTYEKTVKTLTS